MGTLNLWEVNDNHIPTAITVLLNRQSFQAIIFTRRESSEKEEKKSKLLIYFFCYLCVAQKWMRENFEFAVDIFDILNVLSASKNCGQMDECILQVENEPQRRIQNKLPW